MVCKSPLNRGLDHLFVLVIWVCPEMEEKPWRYSTHQHPILRQHGRKDGSFYFPVLTPYECHKKRGHSEAWKRPSPIRYWAGRSVAEVLIFAKKLGIRRMTTVHRVHILVVSWAFYANKGDLCMYIYIYCMNIHYYPLISATIVWYASVLIGFLFGTYPSY